MSHYSKFLELEFEGVYDTIQQIIVSDEIADKLGLPPTQEGE